MSFSVHFEVDNIFASFFHKIELILSQLVMVVRSSKKQSGSDIYFKL